MASYKFVVTAGEEDYEEFEYKDLKLYIFDGALWVSCRGDVEDVEVKYLEALDDAEDGEEVTIELDDALLENARNMRALKEFEHPMSFDEFNIYLVQPLLSEEYFEKCRSTTEQIREDLMKQLCGIEKKLLSPSEIDIIIDRLNEYLLALGK
jgi:hypothetical protein